MSSCRLLFVDDDMEDQYIMQEAFKANGKSTEILYFANDGEMAIQWLHGLEKEDLPHLIVLDLNMPRMDGKATLRYLKENDIFKPIPVIIYSTSEHNGDKQDCRQLGASLYITKPSSFEQWNKMARVFGEICEGNTDLFEQPTA